MLLILRYRDWACTTIQLLHAVTGPMAFCTREGGTAPETKSRPGLLPRGCHYPTMVYKTHWPQISASNNYCFVYLGNMIIPLLKVMLSSSNIIRRVYMVGLISSCSNKKQFFTVPSNPLPFRTKRWISTNAGNNQGNVHRLTKLMLPVVLVQDSPGFVTTGRAITPENRYHRIAVRGW